MQLGWEENMDKIQGFVTELLGDGFPSPAERIKVAEDKRVVGNEAAWLLLALAISGWPR